MKLLLTATSYVPAVGGAQIHLHELAKRLSPEHQVDVATFWQENRSDWLLGTTLLASPNPSTYAVDGVFVHRIAYTGFEKARMALPTALYFPTLGLTAPLIARVILPKLETLSGDAALIHNVRIGREHLSLASLKLARRKAIPFVVTPLHHPRWMDRRYALFHHIFREADQVIALTNAEKSMLMKLGVRESNIAITGIGPVLSPDYDEESFTRQHAIGSPFILFLGQHYRYKGYSHLLAAAELVWKEVPEAHFVFAGPSVGDSELTFQDTDRRIHRLGIISLEEKTSALAACSILCVPSTQESFGGVYAEAWSFAKPVIGCAIPAVSELIDDGVNGILVEQDSRAIADRLVFLLKNPSMASAMGISGKHKVDTQYNWPLIVEKTLLAYQDALD